jgi:molecular chaperone DnaK
MYAVGIDIGTTYTAAAVWRDGRAEIVPLGSHSAAIPSVVFARSDGSFLAGESAGRRGLSEPNRVAREFKRRLGDTSPILLGGTPYSAAALTARMLRSVLDVVSGREGGPPESICVTHPAHWGPYKMDVLRQVVRLADIDQPVRFTTEPQATADYYAHQQRLEPGAVMAVYDLGGGTFDAAALRRTADGFDLIGEPEGIERLGGLDFDDAIFAHVAASVGGALEQIDKKDPAAAARLRDECVQAKEVLSEDTDTTIPVLLPAVSTEVRLTRSELEEMVRPSIQESIEALRRAISSAGYAPQALRSVLLVGGSSRMPIVARMVTEELGRPVAVDANPKHAVALGAAWQAGTATAKSSPAASAPSTPAPSAPAVSTPAPSTPAVSTPVVSTPAVSTPVVSPTPAASTPVVSPTPAASTPVVPPAPVVPPTPAVPLAPVPSTREPADPWAQGAAASVSTPADPLSEPDEPTGEIPVRPDPADKAPGPDRAALIPGLPPAPKAGFSGRAAIGSTSEVFRTAPPPVPPAKTPDRRVPALTAAALGVLLLASGGTVWLLTQSDGRDDTTAQVPADQQQGRPTPAGSAPAGGPPSAANAVPADEQCTDQMKKSTRWVCLRKATIRDNTLTISYDAEWNGTQPNIRTGFHLHVYGGDGTKPDEATMGSQAVKHSKYYFEDKQPSVRRTSDSDFEAVGDAKKVCARIAQTGHGLAKAFDGSYHTGNCIPIQRG